MPFTEYLHDVLGIRAVVRPPAQAVLVVSAALSLDENSFMKKMLGSVGIESFICANEAEDLASVCSQNNVGYVLYFGAEKNPQLSLPSYRFERVADYISAASANELKARKMAAWDLLKQLREDMAR